MSTPTVLITGASGRLGRLAMAQLLSQPHGPLAATSRDRQRLLELAQLGVDTRYADFDNPASLPGAFSGAQRTLLISTGCYIGERRIQQQRQAIDAMRQAGVRHIVYTSLLNADRPGLGAVANDHAQTEAALHAGGLAYTSLRNGFYMDSFLTTLPKAIASGVWTSAAGDGKIAYVTQADCARAAVAALHQGGHGGRVLNITAPVAIGAEEIVRTANQILGTSIAYVALTPEEMRQRLLDAGQPAQMANIVTHIDRAISQGAMDAANDDFEKLTGEKACGLAEFLIANKHRIIGNR
ncbi:SDR family oxidoreductase [Janthinobacterium agaricidamnosum]|uniref:NAD dependent epimerase/dehydratase family protein n=1 Tax=Janthinobacterium agaricidamnosum NBRC 102515 = DSM 9628 TaxID=1349767 RepID=W0V4I2_9BURK|nr:SDR family oxidoreductase [Janthinobacterium agaricidamnosum]CDG82182.1 NAD dependent epimerase/dehydratase family protein [Janthinobacterium agaricidamnosum NBRC 102515 = DSM 9628]